MILVTGGTGSLAHQLLPRLLAAGERVRVLSRNPEARLPAGCELAVGDILDTEARIRAVTGCSTVIAAAHGIEGGRGAGPEAVDGTANTALIDAARSVGVTRFVLMSTQGAAPDSPLPLMRAKFAAEQHLVTSGLEWLAIRPALSYETWLFQIIGEKVLAGGPALVLGRGENPITFVSARDVAAVVARALADRTSGEILDVTGPENHTLRDLAAATHAATTKFVPRGALRVMQYAAKPFVPAFARKARMAYHLDTDPQTTALGLGSPTPVRTLAAVAAERFGAAAPS
jgi:uncharacterized protein YbjT (DUF2867 family)